MDLVVAERALLYISILLGLLCVSLSSGAVIGVTKEKTTVAPF
jgi:hypothetical protein